MTSYVNLNFEPIHPRLRECLEEELARLPGARIVKREGRLIFCGLNGFEIAAETLCAAKARWAELSRRAPIMPSEIWDFLLLLIAGDVRLRDVPGANMISLDLPPYAWPKPETSPQHCARKLNGHAASSSAPA